MRDALEMAITLLKGGVIGFGLAAAELRISPPGPYYGGLGDVVLTVLSCTTAGVACGGAVYLVGRRGATLFLVVWEVLALVSVVYITVIVSSST